MSAPTELKFVDFEVQNEPWNTYKLKDGSVLRIKVILVSVIAEEGDELSISTRNTIGVYPNKKFIGFPSPLKQDEDLESLIEEEDIEIIEKTDNWNKYYFPSEENEINIKGVPVVISRTSKRDEKGIPLYSVNVQLLIKPKKKPRRKAEKDILKQPGN